MIDTKNNNIVRGVTAGGVPHGPQGIHLRIMGLTAGRTRRTMLLFFALAFLYPNAFAEVAIETSVSRSRLAVGEELTLDVIVSNAEGEISKPAIRSIEGFNCYSQGRSQEISVINGHSSSRSIFSYVLIANSAGKKTIGPFEIGIGGRNFKIAPVEVEVTPDGGGFSPRQSGNVFSQGAVPVSPQSTPSSDSISSQDIFVKVWIDKNEVFFFFNDTATTEIYTRLSATYKGFEKEGIKIAACFDIDPAKCDKKEGDIPILQLEELKNFVKSHKIKIGIIAVPDVAAQQILDMMLSSGIKGVLNFAPIRLRTSGDCVVNNVNLILELETVIYCIINGMDKMFHEINEDEKP